MPGKFKVYQDRDGRWRHALYSRNGTRLLTGAAYTTKAAARKGCESVQAAADGAVIVEVDS